MKKTILLILAMCFAFAMPVQATEVVGLAPIGSLIGSERSEAPVVVLADSKVTTCRCMRSQLEAAELYLTTETVTAMIGGGSSNAPEPTGQGAMHEVGWRVSTPNMNLV